MIITEVKRSKHCQNNTTGQNDVKLQRHIIGEGEERMEEEK